MGRLIDRVGKVYDRLTVKYRVEDRTPGRPLWHCECSCGNTAIISSNALSIGTRSCGCVQLEYARNRSRTHGMAFTPVYASWNGMRDRCLNPNNQDYHHYGGRGIAVCERWKDSFENFYADMGDKPSIKHSLDRINNDGNYEPSNCRWATQQEQVRNRRPSIKPLVTLTVAGVTKTKVDWAEGLGISVSALNGRLRKGWSLQNAVTRKRNFR